jgi:hypothetical protein
MTAMTTKELAALLDGREYGSEITEAESEMAEQYGLVAVFGASDDLMELRGAIDDEFGAFGGMTVHVTEGGLFENKCSSDDCPYAADERGKSRTITAQHFKGGEAAWTFETDIPHETFDIYEDGDLFCKGIVFSLDALQ